MYKIFKLTSNPTVDFAAEELKKYLRMMMPRCGEIPIEYNPEADDGFRLGLMEDFDLDMSDAKDISLDDIVYVNTCEKGGVIAGSNPCALLIAVYRFLRLCGCRWLFPGVDGEWIPEVEKLPDLSYRKKADHRYRGQCNEGAESQQAMLDSIDFAPKIGMNSYMLEFDIPRYYYDSYYNHDGNTYRSPEPVDARTVLQWKRQCEAEIKKRGLRFHDMGHGWTAEPFGFNSSGGWVSSYIDYNKVENAKYLAMYNGERKFYCDIPLNTNICMSNPEARQIIANCVADYARVQNNVDYLHVWLADSYNNHCECLKCAAKNVSDWYITLLNDIDAELSRRNLSTHIVFIAYVDTMWAPIEEKINNSDRFTMLFAPITRLYTETYAEKPDMDSVRPFKRNENIMPQGMRENLAYLNKWKEQWKGDCIAYEYHFWRHQYYDPSGLTIARIVYEDIVSLRNRGINGMIEDGSQRSFFPTGFAFYVYGETLFNASLRFEDLIEDYFSHAFGDEYRTVLEYLEKIEKHLDFEFLSKLNTDADMSDDKMALLASEIPWISADFARFADIKVKQKYRASTVSWQLLQHHVCYINDIAKLIGSLAKGNEMGYKLALKEFIDDFSQREIYIERYYDHYIASHVFSRGQGINT